jgi:hypothetical protein
MAYEITPEPDEDEREAILAALAEEAGPPPSPWAQALLPGREDERSHEEPGSSGC